MNARSALARVRGLGAAHDGTAHWWAQRLTAVALIPLSLIFVAVVLAAVGADRAAVAAVMANPLIAVLMLLFIAVSFHHLKLGLQVVIEDYIHHEGVKVAALMANVMGCYGLATACVFAVLKLAIAG